MNERIKELIPKPWTFPYPDREMYSREQMEHLAELIIKECAYIVENSPWQLNRGYKAADQANLVKQHFGAL
jgi:hypothetical protein